MKRIISFVLCAAMLMSSFVFVAQAADPQVQSVIDAINAIGDVHRNETLLENLSFDGYTVNSIPTSELWETQEWTAYAPYNRLEFAEHGSDIKKAVLLKWNRDFQVTFQFVPAQNNIENPKKDVAIFGGKIMNLWVGYHFGKEQFFIGNNTSEGPDTPTAYRHLSEVMKLDPNTAYTMTVQFITAKDADGNVTIEDDKIMNGGTPGYVTIFLDGKEVVSSKGQNPKNGNRTNPKYMPFNPYKEKNDAWSWGSFVMFPCGTICNIVRFEASTLDATDETPWGTPVGAPAPYPYETHPDDDTIAYYIAANTEFLNKPYRVHDMAENFVANGGWYKSSFTCNAYVDSGEKIAAAKAAYMALTPPQKKEVSNYADLVSKMRTYYTMQPAYGGINAISEEALKVVDLIDAIGVVTKSSGDAIKAAEDAYNALTDELKAEVYNYDVLVCSLEEYDAFTNPAVPALIAAIDALAPITLDSKAALEDCESKYAAFNSALKASVTNYSVLVEARKTYDTLCVEEVRALIGAIGDVTKESADAVNAAKTKYDALRDDLKARVADIKPVLDAAKTDLRMINLSGLDYTDPAVITEVRLTKNYYQIQTAAAKALMKNKSYLDSALDTVIDVVEAKHIDSAIDSIGDISFMDGTSSVNGIGYLGKKGTGYSNLSVWDPLHEKTTADMHGPYKVSFDIVIKRWINNEDDNSARIAGYLGTGVAMAYNYVEKKFVIGNSGDGGAGGMYNPTGDYASSDVVELKLNVPYNIAFEVDRDHLAIYLNGKQVAYTSELAMDPTSYFLFYPAGLDMIVTGYEMIFNGEVLSYYDNADKMFEERTFGKSGNVILGNETWVGFNSGWNVEALTTNDNVVNDSGYIVETLYNRYMALSDKEKALVTKADTLIAKYQEYTGKKNQGLVTDAINAINAIGDVTLDSIDAITAAEYAYSEVPAEIKSQVTNADVLTAARAKYDELYGNDLNEQIASLGEITADKIDVVKGLKAEYDAMTENQKSYVTNKAILDAALDDLAEFAKANPVIDAIQSFIGADFEDETPIAGLVREFSNAPGSNNYTLFASENVAKNYFGTKKYQIDYDFKYTEVESAINGVIQGSNGDKAVLTGIDIAHSLVFIKAPAGPFGLQDPQTYTVSAPFTFSANRWYHFTAVYENESVKIYIDGKEKLALSEIDKETFEDSDWYIMQSYGINGAITNASITTNAEPGVIPEGIERTWISDSIGGTVQNPATTIGQENKDNVTRARAMYNELSPKARTAVTNYRFLTSTEAVLGMTSPSDSALAVIDMINALDRDSDQTAIDAALDAYKALSTRDKRSVTNYGKIQTIIDERAAADVEAKIAALTVESSNDDFALAQRAYDNLTAAQKALVTNYDRIAELRSAKAVKAVVDAIAALNDDSAEADIAAAQAAYNALTDAEKAQVTNYTDLEALIARISAAKVKAVVDAIAELTDDSSSEAVNGVKAQYDALTDAEKAQVTNIDKLIDLVNKFSASVAQKVIDAINGLSASSTEDEVMAVKAQYDALTADEKARVTNYDALKTLIDAISAAKAKVVSDQIANLDENSDEAAFAAAEAAYAALSDDAKAFVTNYSRIADLRGAKNVTAMIEALTNDSSDEDVAAALAAYNALSEMGQLYVKNYAHLEAVRSAKAVAAVIAAIDALSKDSTDDEIDAAEEAYEALTDEEKALVTNYDRIDEIREQKKDPAVQAVIQMIAKLDVNSTNDELLAVVSAYEALTDEQKAKVLNYDMIAEICDQKAAAVVAQVNALPDVYFADIFHHESAVKAAMSTYEVLIDSSKAKVTNYEKLKAISDKLAALHAWDADKQVNILNSTLAAMSKYTQETIDNFAKQPAIGMHYFFEEVGYVERGDSTTGYFAFEEAENKSVKDQRYVNLEFDIKVTDADVLNGWPMLYKFMLGDTHVGYDFVNKAFFCGSVTGMDHGALSRTDVVAPHDFEFGVWHHLEFLLDAENVKIVFDGETVLEGTFSGQYDFLIMYPWLCNLEMTNVVYTDKFGKEVLSPFRNATNNPTGWSKRSNAKDAVMLDHVKTSIEDARDAYEKLTDEQKAQIVGIDVLDKVEAMIELSGKNEIVITDGTADVQVAAEGDTVTVTANEAPAGKVFDKWEVVSGGVTLADANAAKTTFVMGAEKVELKAVYKDAGHAVKVTDGTADVASAAAGATVTITAGAAPAGKVFDKWEVVAGGVTLADANAASTTFVMGDADVEIKAVYKNAVMMGDADGNGKVNAKDIIAVMRHMLGNTPDGFIEAAADMDANGKVNAKDIIAIMRAMLAK